MMLCVVFFELNLH
jgi:beta-glucosidase